MTLVGKELTQLPSLYVTVSDILSLMEDTLDHFAAYCFIFYFFKYVKRHTINS